MDHLDDSVHDQPIPARAATPPAVNAADAPVPWQMIEPGRYQPRRTRGSCVGRELG